MYQTVRIPLLSRVAHFQSSGLNDNLNTTSSTSTLDAAPPGYIFKFYSEEEALDQLSGFMNIINAICIQGTKSYTGTVDRSIRFPGEENTFVTLQLTTGQSISRVGLIAALSNTMKWANDLDAWKDRFWELETHIFKSNRLAAKLLVENGRRGGLAGSFLNSTSSNSTGQGAVDGTSRALPAAQLTNVRPIDGNNDGIAFRGDDADNDINTKGAGSSSIANLLPSIDTALDAVVPGLSQTMTISTTTTTTTSTTSTHLPASSITVALDFDKSPSAPRFSFRRILLVFLDAILFAASQGPLTPVQKEGLFFPFMAVNLGLAIWIDSSSSSSGDFGGSGAPVPASRKRDMGVSAPAPAATNTTVQEEDALADGRPVFRSFHVFSAVYKTLNEIITAMETRPGYLPDLDGMHVPAFAVSVAA